MADLILSATLSLPASYVTECAAILARRGAGKTYTAMKIAEELAKLNLPFVAIDPTGVMWGLRSSADGTKTGWPIIILGGEHGDLPLEPSSGRLIADLVVESGHSVILDLSYFESRADETRFLLAFAERLYRLKAKHREPLHLLLDEADRYAPQVVTGDLAKLVGAWEAIVRLGRSRGLGMTMVSQRPAVINKNVLSQIGLLIVMQITGSHDRKAILDWVKDNATPEEATEVIRSLAELGKGEAWVWSPDLRILVRIKVAKRTTFDSSRTPEAGKVLAPKAIAPVDLADLAERMAATIERAKETDPKLLQRRIRELEAEVARLVAAVPDVQVQVETVEVVHQVVPPELREILTEAVMLLDNAVAVADADSPPPVRSVTTTEPARVSWPTVDTSDGGICRPAPRRPLGVEDGSLSKAERAILSVLVQAPSGGFTRRQMSIRSGYPYKSKSIDNALGALRGRGYVNPGLPLVATEAGVDALPEVEGWTLHPDFAEAVGS